MENIQVEQPVEKQLKTPSYIRKAQKAYRDRKREENILSYNKRNCEYMKKYREKKKIEHAEYLAQIEMLKQEEIINSLANVNLQND